VRCNDFALDAISPQNLENPLGTKLWLAGKAVGLSPFDEGLLNLPQHQLDWILAMYAKDHPKDYKMVRVGADGNPLEAIDPQREKIRNMVAWSNVLMGEALQSFQGNDKSRAILDAIERRRATGQSAPLGTTMTASVQEFDSSGKLISKVG